MYFSQEVFRRPDPEFYGTYNLAEDNLGVGKVFSIN